MTNAATGITIEFTYNHAGIRKKIIMKVNGVITETTEYILNGKQVLGLRKGTDEMHFYYDAQGRTALVNYNGTLYGYVHNLQGDIVAILNAGGSAVAEYKYDAWGKPVHSTIGTIAELNPFRYRGYVWDEETGLYYNIDRYYYQSYKRFLNVDFAGVSSNVYSYCKNDAVNYKDVNGENREYANISFEIGCETLGSFMIMYNVPLYNQGQHKPCWAYSQVMIEDYKAGVVSTVTEAESKARTSAQEVYGPYNWDRGGWSTNTDALDNSNRIYNPSMEEIYNVLVEYGPLCAYYNNTNGSEAHLVVVTGVDVTNDLVYTNNPQGYSGVQSYNDFDNGYVGQPSNITRSLKFLLVVNAGLCILLAMYLGLYRYQTASAEANGEKMNNMQLVNYTVLYGEDSKNMQCIVTEENELLLPMVAFLQLINADVCDEMTVVHFRVCGREYNLQKESCMLYDISGNELLELAPGSDERQYVISYNNDFYVNTDSFVGFLYYEVHKRLYVEEKQMTIYLSDIVER